MVEQTETHTELMTATGRALATHGVAELTTQKIADEWGRAQSLVHYYHETKTDLIVAYIDHLRERQQSEYRARADDPPVERIRWILGWASDRAEDEGGDERDDGDRTLTLLELHATAAHEERYRAALNGLEDDSREFLVTAIRDGIEDGSFREVDPDAVATVLLAAQDGGVLRTATLGRADDGDTLRRELETYLRSVLYAGEDG